MKLLRKLLFPIVPVYYVVTWLRNLCYDSGIFKSKSYELPIICVGNLSVGGTGKTPMIEYLISILKEDYKVATLSRGYKRSTKGFQMANTGSSASSIGDEPFQFFQKYKSIIVSVDSDRQNGISELQKTENSPEIILLDDAFQHRRVKAGLNILLTTFDKLYMNDFALPTGDLREPKSGAKRADIIVVTKCPNNVSDKKKKAILNRINPLANQMVFFSEIQYSETLYSNNDPKPMSYLKDKKFTLVTGIANANPLLKYLNDEGYNYEHLNFKDHHSFSENEIKCLSNKELLLTTEKDFTRLKDRIPVSKLYYLPIKVSVSESEKFNTRILDFVSSY